MTEAAHPSLPDVRAGDHDALAHALASHGACRIAGFPDATATRALRDDLQRLSSREAMEPAATGRGAGRTVQPALRGDRTLWLDDARCGPVAGAFLASLDRLRLALNERLFLGLVEVEAHYASYPPGAGYTRHRDRFRDNDARVISLVAYLNVGWNPDEGGALRLYRDDAAVDIAPIGGTAVCFRSELEHEVLPASRERSSIAAWFRRRG